MDNQALAEYLARLNMSQLEFAKIIGVTEGAVHHWITGRREIPGYVVRLIDYFEDDIRDFKGED